jgi:hypothetical protein
MGKMFRFYEIVKIVGGWGGVWMDGQAGEWVGRNRTGFKDCLKQSKATHNSF